MNLSEDNIRRDYDKVLNDILIGSLILARDVNLDKKIVIVL